MKTLIAAYRDLADARNVVEELVDAGISRDAISLTAGDYRGYSRYVRGDDNLDEGVFEEAREEVAEFGAGVDAELREASVEHVDGEEGAEFGAVVGGLTGLLVGLGALAIPGVGPIIAAGPLASALIGTGVGAAAGAATGGLVASLIDMGVDETEAEYYAESVRRGGAVVAVSVTDVNEGEAARIMRAHNPVDLTRSAEAWRERGWGGYSPTAEPFEDYDLDRDFYTYE